MTNKDIQLLKKILKLNNRALHYNLVSILPKYYSREKIISTPKYIMVEGDIPICLVAHLDTVFQDIKGHKLIFHDTEYNVMWSPAGLGADDRAGVYAILKVLQAGYRPYIIFTQDEEKGCLGAQALVHRFPESPWKKLKYILELDRQGQEDCVFYNCENPEFTSYVESFGFKTEWGTFSDISEIAPAWGVAAVNLSVGYISEHTYSETLFIDDLENTIEKVKKMLDSVETAPVFEYIEMPHTYCNSGGICFLCGKAVDVNSPYACVCSECASSWDNLNI